MISNRILTKTCSVMEISGTSFDTFGCPLSSTFSLVVSGIPTYYTEVSYSTLPGKEPIKNIYLMYINTDKIDTINTGYKVSVDNKMFDILNIEEAFNSHHIELIIKEISI